MSVAWRQGDGQSSSRAALSAWSIWARRSAGRRPTRSVSFARSRVVTWWHRATLGRLSLADPAGSGTVVGARLACASEVEIGTMMTERHEGVRLNPSFETTTTGRRPRCSEPERGLRSAQNTSPRFTGSGSAAPWSWAEGARLRVLLPRGRDRGPHGCLQLPRHSLRSFPSRPPFAGGAASSRWHTGRRQWLDGWRAPPHP